MVSENIAGGSSPDFQSGDCRTSLLTDYPELMLTTEIGSKTSDLLAQQVGPASAAGPAASGSEAVLAPMEFSAGQQAVECPVGCDLVTFPIILSLFPSLFPSFCHFFHHFLFAAVWWWGFVCQLATKST